MKARNRGKMKTNQTLIGDCRETLKQIPDNFVQTCITSPPYWGLRDYGTATWEGGDENCEHEGVVLGNNRNFVDREGRGSNKKSLSSGNCVKCGAIRKDNQLGLEETPEEFVENLVGVFREVKRVLRDDGTVWLNLGDSYASNQAAGDRVTKYSDKQSTNKGKLGGKQKVPSGLKPKDLIGIPWRVAFALQADGWYLRQDIIWHKPNPMPESIKDRCTKSHEYIFLLSKNKKYYFDHEAIKEDCVGKDERQWADTYDKVGSVVQGDTNAGIKRTKRYSKDGTFKRNKRSVWTVNTKPYKKAHFAVFPPDLITPCMLAGSTTTACADCGKPYERQVETIRIPRWELPPDDPRYRPSKYETEYDKLNGDSRFNVSQTKDLGFQKQCQCETNETVGSVVLDPFMGSGTTGMVAQHLGRRWLGCELNEEYIDMQKERTSQQSLL
jgi:DNA modification methylase